MDNYDIENLIQVFKQEILILQIQINRKHKYFDFRENLLYTIMRNKLIEKFKLLKEILNLLNKFKHMIN